MPITSDDIKLMQPERLTDNPDGGGQMTGQEVIDGDINNLFDDISRIDRTNGNVSLRKAFLKVDTATADLYLDAHAILSAQPADPNVSGLLFNTDDFYDERDQARQRIESFVVPGPVTQLNLRGDQLQGQKSIIVYAATINNVTPPEIGDTLMLQEGEILSSQQFIKVLDVEHSTETFTFQVSSDGQIRTFDADQWILQLSTELKQDYPAEDPRPNPSSATRIFSTQQAGNAKYFGTSTLAEPATAGDTSVRVKDIFAPIIPTASNETPVIDQKPGGFVSQVVESGSQDIEQGVEIDNEVQSELPTAVVPGSVSFTFDGVAFTDRGGKFVDSGGNEGVLEGSRIDYLTGAIAWISTKFGPATLTYRPGALFQSVPNTGKIDIDETNRNFNYVLSLDPPPARRTLKISYQWLGKWFEIQDDGTGKLVGDGSGQVSYTTGSVAVTLQAQPDANSVIFYRWTEGGVFQKADTTSISQITPARINLNADDLKPGSVTIDWVSGGVAKSATDSAGDGVLSGDATGTVDYAEGVIDITNADAPDAGWDIGYTFHDASSQTTQVAVAEDETQADITLTTSEVPKPGSIAITLKKAVKLEATDDAGVVLSTNFIDQFHQLSDNGQGNIINRREGEAVGTIDYATGDIVIAGNQFFGQVN